MPKRQLDLFAESPAELPRTHHAFDRQKWLCGPHPPEWQEREYERALEFVRASLPAILESFRTDGAFPWHTERTAGAADHLPQPFELVADGRMCGLPAGVS